MPLLARLHSYLFISINWPSKVKSEVGIGASVLSASASDRGPGDDLRVDVEQGNVVVVGALCAGLVKALVVAAYKKRKFLTLCFIASSPIRALISAYMCYASHSHRWRG